MLRRLHGQHSIMKNVVSFKPGITRPPDSQVEGGPLKVNLPFDEAIRRALQVAPPEDGWADERPRRRKGGRKR